MILQGFSTLTSASIAECRSAVAQANAVLVYEPLARQLNVPKVGMQLETFDSIWTFCGEKPKRGEFDLALFAGELRADMAPGAAEELDALDAAVREYAVNSGALHLYVSTVQGLNTFNVVVMKSGQMELGLLGGSKDHDESRSDPSKWYDTIRFFWGACSLQDGFYVPKVNGGRVHHRLVI